MPGTQEIGDRNGGECAPQCGPAPRVQAARAETDSQSRCQKELRVLRLASLSSSCLPVHKAAAATNWPHCAPTRECMSVNQGCEGHASGRVLSVAIFRASTNMSAIAPNAPMREIFHDLQRALAGMPATAAVHGVGQTVFVKRAGQRDSRDSAEDRGNHGRKDQRSCPANSGRPWLPAPCRSAADNARSSPQPNAVGRPTQRSMKKNRLLSRHGGGGAAYSSPTAQLHAVPDGMQRSDGRADPGPLACAIHSALRAVEPNADVLVVGAGTLGVLAAGASRTHPRRPHHRRGQAREQRELAEGSAPAQWWDPLRR